MVSLIPLSAAAAKAAAPLTRALDTVLPPRCLSCQEPMLPPGGLCPDCWPNVHFLAAPLCHHCGAQLPTAETALCETCRHHQSPIDRIRAAFIYDEGSRDLILQLKHADALAGVPILARWLARAGAPLLAEADVLAPVPLHWRRLFTRRYNQSAELARALGALSGVPVWPDTLVRPRGTRTQGGLDRAARQANVRDAFQVKQRYRPRMDGQRIVLIDDVYTTGATLEACASELLAAGAKAVDALTLARVERGAPLP